LKMKKNEKTKTNAKHTNTVLPRPFLTKPHPCLFIIRSLSLYPT